jgi:hypothetical protein
MVSWYCKIADVELGPMSQDKLVKMARDGRLSPEDLVRNASKKKWYKAKAVKGLTFRSGEPKAPETEARETVTFADSGTGADTKQTQSATSSAEANRLLKAFKKNKESETGPTPVSIEQRRDDGWRPPPSKIAKPLKRKRLDPKVKAILAVTAAIVVLLGLFSPHMVPRDYVSEGKTASATGRLTQFVFTPPEIKLEVSMRGVGNMNLGEFTMDDDGKAYAMVMLPINWMRLALEWLGVIVVGAGACGYLMLRATVAELPELQPAHPRQRPQRV